MTTPATIVLSELAVKGADADCARRHQGCHQPRPEDDLRCKVQFLRNALAYANKGQRQAVLAVINTIFVQESPESASAPWRLVIDQLREKFPKLAR